MTPPCRNRSFPITCTPQPRTHATLSIASELLLLLSTLPSLLPALPALSAHPPWFSLSFLPLATIALTQRSAQQVSCSCFYLPFPRPPLLPPSHAPSFAAPASHPYSRNVQHHKVSCPCFCLPSHLSCLPFQPSLPTLPAFPFPSFPSLQQHSRNVEHYWLAAPASVYRFLALPFLPLLPPFPLLPAPSLKPELTQH